ncbi:MAG: phosphatidylcholine/phosphatidylserine synthase [Pseudomonadota bacterium]
MPKLKRRFRRRFRHGLSVNRLLPNAVTLLALCAGVTGVRMALQDRWEAAVGLVVFAMLLDAVDGRLARMMDAASEFGAQLDSLSDVINFGVAPPLILYMWAMGDTGGIGWALALFFTICCTMRLARFNVALGDEDPPPWAGKFFTGVPAPAGAGLALLPMALAFVFGDDFFRNATLNGLVLLVVGGLMISRLPTFSAKKIKIKRHQVGFVLIGVGAFLAFLVSTPWVTLSAAGLIYLIGIPVAALSFLKVRKAASNVATQDTDQDNSAP